MSADRERPYVGLDFFGEEDAGKFFGREAERKRIIGNLRASRLTLLYAQSGVGKSSLLRAGVAARLRELAVRAADHGRTPRYLPVVFSAWRDDPVADLVGEVHAAMRPFLGVGNGVELRPDRLDEALRTAASSLDATPLVILDQFEEFFVYHDGDEAGERFVTGLASCLEQIAVRAHFLVSIREDAYSRIGERFKDRIPNVYANYLHLDYLDESAARAAITGPLASVASGPSRIEDALVDEVLQQVRRPASATDANGSSSSRRFETAYLQLVMERLWTEERRTGSDLLRLETLGTIGGANTIVRRHFDGAVEALDDEAQDALAAAFRFLVTSAGTKIALTTRELSELTERPESSLEPALERMQEARILRPVTSEERGGRYELFHDVLGAPAIEWRKRHDAARHERAAFETREAEERGHRAAQRQRLVRRVALALSALVVLLAAMTTWALIERHRANTAQERARSEALAADAIGALDQDPERSVVLAQAAWDVRHTDQARDALRRVLGASRERGRFAVGSPSYATLSDGGTTLATIAPGRATLWRTESRVRLASVAAGQEPWGVTVAANGTSAAFLWGTRGGWDDARVVSVASGAAPVTLRGSADASRIELSADGRFAAGVSMGAVRVWSARTGRILATLPGERRGLSLDGLTFDPGDEHRIVAGDCRGTLVSWRWSRGATRTLGAAIAGRGSADPNAACIIKLSPSGTRAVETLITGSAVLWDLQRNRAVSTRLGDDDTVADVAFSPDGTLVATAARKIATVFATASGARVALLSGHTDWVNTVAFNPRGDRVVTSSSDATARIWDLASATTLAALRGDARDLLDATFTHGGVEVATVSADGSVRRWNADFGATLTGHHDWVLSAAVAPDGRHVASVDVQGTLLVHDLKTATVVGFPKSTQQFRLLNAVAYDPRGRRLALGGDNYSDPTLPAGRVVVLDARSRHKLRAFKPAASVLAVHFSPDGRWLAATEQSGQLMLWRLRDGKRFYPTVAGASNNVSDAEFSPDGRSLVTAGYDGVAHVLDVATRRTRRVAYRHGSALFGATFSPDGRTVLSYGADATAQLWDAATGRTRHVLRGHSGRISSGAFSRDGRRIVTGGADQTTRVWDVGSGRLLSAQRLHGEMVNSVAFSPDGRKIVSAGDDHAVRIYPCTTCVPTDRLAHLAPHRQFFTASERRAIVQAG